MNIVPYPEEARRPIALVNHGLATQLHEVQWLVWKAAQVPGNILEIGTHLGATARAMAMAFPTRMVHTVDDPRAVVHPEQQHEVLPEKDIGRLIRGLTNVRRHRPPFDYRGTDIGLAFIDGDHSFDAVKRDTEAALKHARTVVWHDVFEQPHPWVKVYEYLTKAGIPAIRVAGTNLAYYDTPFLAGSPLNKPAIFGR